MPIHYKLPQNLNKISPAVRKRQKMNNRNLLLIEQKSHYKIKLRWFYPLKANKKVLEQKLRFLSLF